MVLEVLPLDGNVGGPWTPWWGLCVAGRHEGIGALGVGSTDRKQLVLRRNLVTLPKPRRLCTLRGH